MHNQTLLASDIVLPYFGEMEVHFTPEQEEQLAEIATKAGTEAEHLVKDAALRLLENGNHTHTPAPEFPVLHLGAVNSLRRRDLYDDAR